ncbi:MAG: hypothetical protein IH586_21360, partial [Anaerolineaceae bacterium]|nr:hypothetical protein [Anaerolineaceae bacterium]
MPSPLFAEIAVNVPQVSGLFHYHIPPDLAEQIAPGSLVIVPFGKQQVQGIVLRLLTEASISETKPIEAVVDPEPVINPVQMELARWISENTLTPLAACFGPMIPPGLGQLADTLFHLNPVQIYLSTIGTLQQRLVRLLQERGDLRGRQIDAALPRQNWRAAARSMIKHGWLVTRPVLQPPTVRPKTVRTVQLACSPEEAEGRLDGLARAGSAALERRQAILRFLIREPWPVEV